jgi:hypothetical protein
MATYPPQTVIPPPLLTPLDTRQRIFNERLDRQTIRSDFSVLFVTLKRCFITILSIAFLGQG